MNFRQIKHLIKTSIAYFSYCSGFSTLYLKKKLKQSALILAYHRVVPKQYIENNTIMNGMYVSEESFKEQIQWFKMNFEIISLEKLIDDIKKKKTWQGHKCVITFDDGWKDNYEYAFPILKKYNIPATIFLVGDFIGKNEPNCWDICFEVICKGSNFPNDLFGISKIDQFLVEHNNMKNKKEKARLIINMVRQLSYTQYNTVYERLRDYYCKNFNLKLIGLKYEMLTLSDLKEMSKYDIDFGYHSKRHYMLTKLPESRLENELEFFLEKYKADDIKVKKIFCYPDGQYNSHIVNRLKALHYKGATRLQSGVNDIHSNPFVLNRTNIHQGNSETISHFISTLALALYKEKRDE